MSEIDPLQELELRQELARRMGGAEGIARQRSRGKLPVRERIACCSPTRARSVSSGCSSATPATTAMPSPTSRPRATSTACARSTGARSIVTGGDFTVRGGSGGGPEGGLGVELRASERAKEWLLPYVRLLDAAGGSVRSFEELGRT